MIAKLFRIVGISLMLLLSSTALAQVAKIGGTWKAVVLKKKKERVPLTKDGSSLVIVINQQAKTWEATAKTGAKEQKTSGTFQQEGDHVVFSQSNGQKHTLKLFVNGDELILIPKDEPDTRLIAQRVR